MLHLRKLLIERTAWFDTCLSPLAELDGYGHLTPALTEMLKHIGREPVRMSDLARQMGVSRQWIRQLAVEGVEEGILELLDDPNDKRSMMIQFSKEGWQLVRVAAARMEQIEDELARRIGKENLAKLCELLALEWGPAAIPVPRTARKPRVARAV